ncbi:MAG: ABC transporter substrate-binding protein [Bacteroidota bacterium]|nr:ABC transporter substrate-binding protein [Bacteroidota bacterium]
MPWNMYGYSRVPGNERQPVKRGRSLRLSNRRGGLLIALFGAWFLPASMVCAQDDGAGKFRTALDLYERRQYKQAAELFRVWYTAYPESTRAPAACVMAARSFLAAGLPAEAEKDGGRFFALYPDSPYRLEAALILAQSAGRTGNGKVALRALALGAIAAPDFSASMLIEALRDSLLGTPLSLEDVEDAFSGLPPSPFSCRYCVEWVSRPAVSREEFTRRAVLKRFCPEGISAEIDSLRNILLPRLGDVGATPIICIALPAASEETERNRVVRDMRDGILSAIDLHNAQGGLPVDVECIYASTSDTFRTLFASMARDRRNIGIIGGVFSEDALSLAQGAGGTGIPCVVPAATAEELTTCGENIIQMNSTFKTRGSILADYVAATRPSAKIAVLAPLEGFARLIAEAFIERARSNRLKLEVVSWYSSGTMDLRPQYKTVAEKISPSDTTAVLFVPLSTAEILPRILRGYLQGGFRAIVLGAGDWNRPDILTQCMEGRDLTVEFESDYAVMEGSSQYRDFAQAYRRRTGREPTRDAVFGYDAARFFLAAVSAGSLHRPDILCRLRKACLVLHSPVDLRHSRSNRALNIMRFNMEGVSRLLTIPDL